MKTALYILLFLFTKQAMAQAIGNYSINEKNAKTIAKQAENFIYTQKDSYAKTQLEKQVEAWVLLTKMQPAKANHWLNYYVSTRLLYRQKQGNTFSNKAKEQLRQIAEKMDKQVTLALESSFEKQLVRYYETKPYNYNQAQQYLLQAYKLNPKNELVYPELTLYYEVEGNAAQRNLFLEKINAVNKNSTLYKFCLSLLKNADENSIIFTNGEYDTYALLRAKNALNKKVAVVSIALLKYEKYRKRILKENRLKSTRFVSNGNALFINSLLKLNKEHNFYFSSTVDRNFLKPIAKDLQTVGFAYKYNSKNIITKEVLWQNIMPLKASSLAGTGGNGVLKNLMPAYITLYRSYIKKDKAKAKEVYYKAKIFAQKTGFWGAKYEVYFK